MAAFSPSLACSVRDVQAYVLYRLVSPSGRTVNYQYAFGRTYLGAAALMVPGRI